jgi:hypothetical protein
MGKKTESSKQAADPALAKPAAKKAAAKKSVAKTSSTPPKKPAFTRDDVALRAYFIAEKRQKAGLPGDAQHDWIEAERQLVAESKKKLAAKSA